MQFLPKNYGNFDLVKQHKLDFTDVAVSKWQSRVTGLTVIHLDYEAPIINGYFVVPTEIFDDSGCPHTLEHLVFMGSEKYPYKGILDLFANRGFSNGTNAWTDTDHTAYTVSTAGEQGFLQLLPIYLDHILYPTITDAGFVTEVHHINGKGEDSGVVYSEMQGRENTPGDLMALKLQRLLHPLGSAYRSETGGLMEALRVLTPQQIRDYHSTYYVPHNLALVVGGKFSKGTESLLRVVQNEIEPTLIKHGQDKGPRPTGWKRPFVETDSAKRLPIEKDTLEVVEFPEKDETSQVLPQIISSNARRALDMLSIYLTSSPVAPLNKEFIEIESPLCSYIYFGEDVRATRNDLPVYIGSVPTEELHDFPKKLKATLQRIVEKDGIDMERMQVVINRDERQLRSKLESAKGDTFSGTIISDVLYGKTDGSELGPSMDEINYYQQLRQWTAEQWKALLQKYYIDPPSVVVVGRPSGTLAEKLEKDEIKRIEEQVARLGPEGLKKAEAELEAAKAEHDRPIPDDILTSFPVPDVKGISWIPVSTLQQPGQGRQPGKYVQQSPELSKHIDSDGQLLPFFVEYDHVESDFTTINAFLSLKNVPDHLRPLMSTYLSSFFSLPVTRSSGERLSHEEVVNRLEDETVSYEAAAGLSGSFTDLFRVSIKVEKAKYEMAVSWLNDLLYNAEFDKDRLAVVAAKIQQSLPELKRDGNTVLNSLWSDLIFSEQSTSRASTVLPQVEFIPQLVKRLQESPEEVIKEFEEIRKHVTDPAGIRFSVSGNVFDIPKPRSTWAKYFSKLHPVELAPVPMASETLSEIGNLPSKKAIVMSLPTIESAFVSHTTKSIQGFDHPEYPAVRLAAEVLNATESYLWRYIRGSGLAYGAYVSLDPETGLLTFSVYRSSNCIGAFEEAKKVINGLADGTVEFNDSVLDAAKSTIVYGVARNVSTSGRAALVSFVNQALKGLPQRYQVDLLEKYQKLTKEDVLAALKKYYLPLFNSESSVAVVVTAPAKAEAIAESLKSEGFEVTQRSLEADPSEMEDGSEESESGDESDSSR
ncbi:cytoplasmic protein [Coprinopsis cinerea okayama7|uniref:Cytoplasmic protein n=1 Tax=Coprinopsis cinerea (strain Okayama-7 / 130 / ATCC MYA-4618 / FGSC 9003) TaxID=240176 RepID=A8N1M2_COPC7|nr:cytoplasmic protein [Coprinopsis cinerea okayama7\|eukprot:XP_001828795.2 cytoplasmic protein [Coprinopsis cinerea okayama7\